MGNRTKVLLVEDNAGDARLLKEILTEASNIEADRFELTHVDRLSEAIKCLEQGGVDVILLDLSLPDGYRLDTIIRTHAAAPNIPIVVLTGLDDETVALDAVREGAQDYLVKGQIDPPLLKRSIRYAMERTKTLEALRQSEEHLTKLNEELSILSRLDREIGYTLNVDQILNLTMDIAIRRTNAKACVVGWLREDTQQLERLACIGSSPLLAQPIGLGNLYSHNQFVDYLFREKVPIVQTEIDSKQSHILISLMVQGEPSGVISLEGVPTGVYEQDDLDFLVHLASRTAAALDRSSAYNKTQNHAYQMEKLYEVSKALSSELDRTKVKELATQGLAVLMDCSTAFLCDYEQRQNVMVVRTTFVAEGTSGPVPAVGTTYRMQDCANILRALFSGPMQFHNEATEVLQSPGMGCEILNVFGDRVMMLVPLISDDKLLGMLVLSESRFDRYFLPDEIAVARSLSGQVSSALKQAALFDNVQQLEHTKSEMISMASHDLRGPLGVVNGYLHVLATELETALSDEHKFYIEQIRGGLQQMQSLLDDVLDLQRVESYQERAWEPVNLRMTLLEVATNLKSQADLKKQQMSFSLPEMDVPVTGSDIQLRQAFTNLISNAIKYTPEGKSIYIRASVENNCFNFEVQDTGYGIPADRQTRIFQRFYRAQTPGTELIKGTGLGLSLVKTVIEAHGGEVWFKSELGVGSTFGCWLPLKDEKPPATTS